MDNFEENMENDEPIVIKMEQVMGLLETQIISKSFIFMFVALLISAFAAHSVNLKVADELLNSKGIYISILIQIGAVLGGKRAITKNIPILVTVCYIAHSYLTGINLSVLFGGIANMAVTSIFVITAIVFLIMAIYGLVTDTNMSSLGTILLMVIVGVALAVLVNRFILKSGLAAIIVNCVGVLIFVGMTAYDMYMIKRRVKETKEENILVLALYGGFELYLDFIDIFVSLLSSCIVNKRRRRLERWKEFLGKH